ncbi:uncharacterized protein LOC133785190 [Humulus lupulus]|uniref:uncharacterized protein LOC133785190 n=1 Tax=Humulus lupulus TaxID=3486 RepID=UPI002B409B42|nr:uncharacterized protein LOC133785190 [Humulus lupulus]
MEEAIQKANQDGTNAASGATNQNQTTNGNGNKNNQNNGKQNDNSNSGIIATINEQRLMTSHENMYSTLLRSQAKAMLTLIVGRLRAGAVTEQAKSLEQRHADELKASKVKYAEQLAAVLEEKNKLDEKLREKKKSLHKAIEQRDQFKESNRVNYRAAKQLEEDLAASRQENTTLEGQIEELEKANASNLKRNAELTRCAARLAEEERARIPASLEISLATGMDGADNEAADVVDQSPPQDPPAPQDPSAP